MRFGFLIAVAAGLLLRPATAAADVASSSPSSFEIHATAETTATPDRAWRALTDVGGWWSGEHSYSQNSRNFHLDARAGGCWCERWNGGQVEHMRVVIAMNHEGTRTLRMIGALGPLQELPLTGVMTFQIQPHAGGATIVMVYRVSGDSSLSLDHIAPGVDTVLMEQFHRLIRYTGSGSAD